jgi:hypothetical protein
VIGSLSSVDSARGVGDIVGTCKDSTETEKYNSLPDNCQYNTTCFGFTRSSSLGTCSHKNIMRHLYITQENSRIRLRSHPCTEICEVKSVFHIFS